jgi:hypothetical protein
LSAKRPSTPASEPSGRLAALECLLLWEGRITNTRIREVLEVTSVHASRLLSEYRETYPRVIERVVPGEYAGTRRLKPELTQGHISEYLELIASVDTETAGLERMPLRLSSPDPALFREIHLALREGRGLIALHRTLANPEGHRRMLFPHALAEVGGQWWTRAYAPADACFDTLSLQALSAPRRAQAQSPKTADADADWQQQVPLRLTAHQDLSYEQAVMIAHQHFGQAAGQRLSVRGPLVSAAVKALRAATDPGRQQPPDYLLQVNNVDEIRRWLEKESSPAGVYPSGGIYTAP